MEPVAKLVGFLVAARACAASSRGAGSRGRMVLALVLVLVVLVLVSLLHKRRHWRSLCHRFRLLVPWRRRLRRLPLCLIAFRGWLGTVI